MKGKTEPVKKSFSRLQLRECMGVKSGPKANRIVRKMKYFIQTEMTKQDIVLDKSISKLGDDEKLPRAINTIHEIYAAIK